MTLIPVLPPATTPRICVATRTAGTTVWHMSADRGPNRLAIHPATNRLKVPQKVVLMPRMEYCRAVPAAISLRLHRSPSPV